jgi:ABC-type Fe3+-siderophore transport system permease subunit
MKIKISNKLNIIPISLYLMWIVFVLYFFFFQIISFSKEAPCGAGYMMIGLPIFTIVFSLFSLLLIAIINLFSKKKYYTDFEFISIPFFVLIGIMILTMLI